MTTMTKFKDLPEDLVVDEILCRVPATYLKRIGSTCKTWNRLFKSDEKFARKHIDKAAKQFIVLTLDKSYTICEMSVDLDGIVPSVEVKRKIKLMDPYTQGAEFDISQVFHCDGLLLCTSELLSRFMVWNPFTEQIKWFQYKGKNLYHCLGYYHKSSTNNKSYKILRCDLTKGFEIYDLSSDSTRILYDIIPPGWTVVHYFSGVSLKGNTYMFARDGKKNISLLKFDYSIEKFVPFSLPYRSQISWASGLSAVRDEKLFVLLEREKFKTEIWVTDKITQSQAVSWSKILAFDLSPDLTFLHQTTFLLDEEKKLVMIFDRWVDETETKSKDMIYIVGEDNQVTQVVLGVDLPGDCVEAILNYVPSLVQIEQPWWRQKEKRLPLLTLI